MKRKIRSQSELGRIKRHYRIRKKLSGTKDVPRLIVHRSHGNLYVQFIDDTVSHTLLSLSTNDSSFKKEFVAKGGNVEAAKKMGAYIAREASKKDIKKIVSALIESKKNYVIIYPNNDIGTDIILNEYKTFKGKNEFKIFPSLLTDLTVKEKGLPLCNSFKL